MALEKPERLFDFLTYQLEHYPLEDCLSTRQSGAKDGIVRNRPGEPAGPRDASTPDGDPWRKYSTQEVQTLVNRLSAGLLQAGITAGDLTPESRDKVAILSKNRPAWIMADLAIQQIGAIPTPIYPTIHPDELKFILNDADVKLIFVNDKELYQKVAGIKAEVPSLREIITFEQVSGARNWQDMLAELTPEAERQIEAIKARITGEHLATILYTSGTTGVPKGVMLSHRNIVSNVFDSFEVLDEIGIKGQRVLSFLPLNHAFERTATYCYLYMGAAIYYAESMDTIANNLREVRPVMFTTVPRLLEKVYEGIMAKGASLTGIKRKLFYWSVGLAERYEINKPLGFAYNAQLALADKLIFSKWREALGGNVKAIITGAAACQVKLLRIFTAAKIVIQEGYGLTETSPIISGNRYSEENRMFGTVGPLLKSVKVRIGEDGEILVQAPTVMMGYYKRPDLTAEVIKDGWFHTGDIGTLISDKFLKLTDRKKEIFKTSGGKYVAPQPIENKMVESPLIEQMMVVGAEQKFVGALIVPAFNVLKERFTQEGRPYPGNTEVVKDKSVIQLVKEAVNQYNKFFNPVEQVKKFELLPGEWTVTGGELTPTLKLKRKVILEKYKSTIERIYD